MWMLSYLTGNRRGIYSGIHCCLLIPVDKMDPMEYPRPCNVMPTHPKEVQLVIICCSVASDVRVQRFVQISLY